jgi:putative flavoprotein involved in K+ transport
MESHEVVVIGGGQAGLAVSHELAGLGVEHVVLERERIGQAWRDRWDSFCLVTPNWTVQLPGHKYDGSDPDGYMLRDEVVQYLETYARTLDIPVREGVEVQLVESASTGGFVIQTSSGEMHSNSVVVCTGAYQRPYRPAAAATFPADLPQIDIDGYKNPQELPAGAVLIVGSGQSGCQIAEELDRAGRKVVLSCGKAPWTPRQIDNRDIIWWLMKGNFFEADVTTLPSPAALLLGNNLGTGQGGGHDLHLRTLQAKGVTLVGHFLGVEDHRVRFAKDLAQTVAWGDERYGQVMNLVRKVSAEQGLPTPEILPPDPFDAKAPEQIDISDFGVVIFAGGFRPDYGSLLSWPESLDDLGFPIQHDGASSVVDGLYFAGVHFLRKRKSSLLLGVGEDAAIIAITIASKSHR